MFEFEEYFDSGCPSCGAEAGEDCAEDCLPIEAPPSLYQMIEEQMQYVAHKVSQNVMKDFENKLLTEKVASVMKDWTKFLRFGQALVNVKELNHAEQVLDFFQDPNPYKRHFALWSELGNPLDEKSETWDMFVEAILNTEKENKNGKQA